MGKNTNKNRMLKKFGDYEFLKKLSPVNLYPKLAVQQHLCWWCGKQFNHFKELLCSGEREVYFQTGICKKCNSDIYRETK